MDWSSVIAGGVAGVGTGTLSSWLTPRAQWSVDKKRDKETTRKELIAGGRALLHDATVGKGSKATAGWSKEDMMADTRFMALQPHLTLETVALFDAGSNRPTLVVRQTDDDSPKSLRGFGHILALRKDIDRLEKAWDLV
jgi:hypothetical protein